MITKHPSTRPAGLVTQKITLFDPNGLSAVFDNKVTLDKHLVKSTLDKYGPIFDPDDIRDWSFRRNPSSVPFAVDGENGFYPWYAWLVAAPVAHASNAVCEALNCEGANIDIPGIMSADVVYNTAGGGAADIFQRWFQSQTHEYLKTPRGLYKFKRDNVMEVNNKSTLIRLVELSKSPEGYLFRRRAGQYASHEGKICNLLCQIIDEMIQADSGHVVVTTQTHYILVRLTTNLQLEISNVCSIHESLTQAEDMVILVLFCTLAALRKVVTYPVGPEVRRVQIPQFPSWVFRPSLGVFWDGARQEQIKFCKPRKPSLLPLPWLGLEGEVMSTANGVSIAHAQLFLFFLTTRVVVKIAHGVAATQRLDREFLAYSTLRTWQGVAIPRIFGMYTSTDENIKVLLMSDAGKTLRDFSDLEPVERRLLFTRLVRLHQSGVLHNDVEPRNVTRSETSGPLVIDFDEASFHHVCMGPSCKELLRLAQVLQLDAGAEIAALAPVARARSTYLTFAALISLSCLCITFLHL